MNADLTLTDTLTGDQRNWPRGQTGQRRKYQGREGQRAQGAVLVAVSQQVTRFRVSVDLVRTTNKMTEADMLGDNGHGRPRHEVPLLTLGGMDRPETPAPLSSQGRFLEGVCAPHGVFLPV